MIDTAPGAPIVVGVDGSQAALNAVVWAVDEALDRDAPLRIVHVLPIEKDPDAPDDAFRLEVQYAESSLRAATAAVKDTEKPVKVETDILWGPVETALINESQSAAMICVGSVGIGPIAREFVGSTAAVLAEKAHCPVAIIRTPHEKPVSGVDWIVVAVNDDPDNDAVIEYAFNEAQLRQAPILAIGVSDRDFGDTLYNELDRRLGNWKQRYPDLHVHPVSTRAGIAGFLAENKDESVQLVVVGRVDAYGVAQVVGPHSHPILRHGECSVLVVR
jgi:nucleotide-binding universal stress UspA family protein